jgi:hypothetical protein
MNVLLASGQVSRQRADDGIGQARQVGWCEIADQENSVTGRVGGHNRHRIDACRRTLATKTAP